MAKPTEVEAKENPQQARLDKLAAWRNYRDSLDAKDRAKVGQLVAELMKPDNDQAIREKVCEMHGVDAGKVLVRRVGRGQKR